MAHLVPQMPQWLGSRWVSAQTLLPITSAHLVEPAGQDEWHWPSMQ